MSRKPIVLIVDDITDNIKSLHNILKTSYRVIATTSGERALQLAQSSPRPDLILLDVMMPKIDGYTVCRELKQNPDTAQIPVIFITAKTEPQDEDKGLGMGAVDYISKPAHPAIVFQRVKTHIQLYNRQRLLESEVEKRTAIIAETQQEIISRLCRAAEFKDNETAMHIVRMSHYAKLLGLAAGMGREQSQLLLQAAPMHDIGKIGIPDHVLLKPGQLTDEERAVMQQHPQIGASIIGEHDSHLLQMAHSIALYHHEKWDGSGYPHGLSGENIPLAARVVALADVFDALTTERPYKKAWSLKKTLEYIRAQAGLHFDPRLVEILLQQLAGLIELKEFYRDSNLERDKKVVV